MNILQQEDIIKGLPDQALQEEAKSPSGQVPQFLVVSEIQRRTDMRSKYKDPNQQQPQGTIADQITQEGIASVQPQQQQPQQGQPMQMRGGGMTPFMRKYAGGGVVRMQAGGITPNEMLQMDAQMMAQKYPFLSGSRDEILQGLTGIDPNDASSISSMFGGAPEIDGVLQGLNTVDPNDLEPMFKGVPKVEQFIASRASNPAPPLSAVRPELFDVQMPQPPMSVENVTEPRLLTLDGVNTLTPDGQRPYPPNTPSVGSLDSFSNAFREDAERAKNLLATLDDSTPQEKEATSNPVSINLPRTLDEIGKDAPKSLKGTGVRLASYQDREDAKYDPSSFGAMFDGSSRDFPSRAKGVIGSNLSNLGSFLSDEFQDVKSSAGSSIDQALTYLGSKEDESKVDSLLTTLGNLTPVEEFANRASGIGDVDPSNRGGFGRFLGGIKDSIVDSSFGNFASNAVGVQGSNGSESSNSVGEGTVLKRNNGPYIPQLANPNLLSSLINKEANSTSASTDTTANTDNSSVGVKSEKEQIKGFGRIADLASKISGFNLEGEKKQAYAMALMALGKGISDGDTAGGLQNAGIAMNAMQEQNADRRDKALDREITSSYYEDKLAEARASQNIRVQSAVESAMTEWNNANMDATPEQQATKRQELLKRYQLLGDTTSTGSDINNQRNAANASFNDLKTI